MKDSKAETSNNITRKKTFTTFGLFWPNDKEIQMTKLLNNLNESCEVGDESICLTPSAAKVDQLL